MNLVCICTPACLQHSLLEIGRATFCRCAPMCLPYLTECTGAKAVRPLESTDDDDGQYESGSDISSDGSAAGLGDDDMMTLLDGDADSLTAEQKERLQVRAHRMAPYMFPHPRLIAKVQHAQLERCAMCRATKFIV